jgi:phage terminase large subunit
LEAFPHRQRIAMLASKGPGKTATEAWCAWNFMLTRFDCNIAAVSITAENLADNLWKEMAKWLDRSPILKATFDWKKTRIEARERPATWWMSARSWPRTGSREEQANSLAGLHADNVMFILDESGGIPDAVLVSAEAALSSCVEGHILQGGNPTQREGSLFKAHQERDRWKVIEVSGDPDDPKRSPRVSIEWARDQIRSYGRDNAWVLVNVFGKFPPTSLNTLIGSDEITAATLRSYREEDIRNFAKILGVDVAFEGDDMSVMWPRQGSVAFAPTGWRNLDGIAGAGAVSFKWGDWDADACFIDDSGGFGRTWVDNLRLLGRSPLGVHFAEKATQPTQFANKRAEMYFNAVQWIRDGGQLPPMTTPGMAELCAALSRTTYTKQGDRLLLEPKKIVKEKLGYSPDHADAFVLTFAHAVSPKTPRSPARSRHQAEWSLEQAFAELSSQNAPRGHRADYDPFA